MLIFLRRVYKERLNLYLEEIVYHALYASLYLSLMLHRESITIEHVGS